MNEKKVSYEMLIEKTDLINFAGAIHSNSYDSKKILIKKFIDLKSKMGFTLADFVTSFASKKTIAILSGDFYYNADMIWQIRDSNNKSHNVGYILTSLSPEYRLAILNINNYYSEELDNLNSQYGRFVVYPYNSIQVKPNLSTIRTVFNKKEQIVDANLKNIITLAQNELRYLKLKILLGYDLYGKKVIMEEKNKVKIIS